MGRDLIEDVLDEAGSGPAEHILGKPGDYFARPYPTVFPPTAQLFLTNIFLGRALGALREAVRYTTTTTRPWPSSGVDSVGQDPYVLEWYGRARTRLTAATAVADLAARSVGELWESAPDEVSWEDRGEAMIQVSQAKILASELALDITSGMFEVMGARATAAGLGLDRYWRDVRTLTLHDHASYKVRDVGAWTLTGALPTPAFVS
jgi:alkylation response protein AidB-like acyl-CoA dehydrogenase